MAGITEQEDHTCVGLTIDTRLLDGKSTLFREAPVLTHCQRLVEEPSGRYPTSKDLLEPAIRVYLVVLDGGEGTTEHETTKGKEETSNKCDGLRREDHRDQQCPTNGDPCQHQKVYVIRRVGRDGLANPRRKEGSDDDLYRVFQRRQDANGKEVRVQVVTRSGFSEKFQPFRRNDLGGCQSKKYTQNNSDFQGVPTSYERRDKTLCMRYERGPYNLAELLGSMDNLFHLQRDAVV